MKSRTPRRTAVRRVKRVLVAGCALVVAIALGVAALGAAWLAGYKVPLASGATYLRVQKLLPIGSVERSDSPTAPFFILLIGNDDRPGVGGARGDALHLLGVNPALRTATILDIPRDTCWRGGKINRANAEGGAPRQAEAVSDLTGVLVSYVVDVNFAAFKQLVDGVGGVTVNVPTAMNDKDSGAAFFPGKQHLNSAQALAFSRDRHDFPQSDIIRTNNQGLLIISAITQLQHQSQSAAGEFHLMSLLYRHAQLVGLGINDLFRLGRLAFRIPTDRIRNITLPTAGGGCLRLAGNAPGLFGDFRDDGVLEAN